eukprot:807763-Prymnesium_polylepis.1
MRSLLSRHSARVLPRTTPGGAHRHASHVDGRVCAPDTARTSLRFLHPPFKVLAAHVRCSSFHAAGR